MDIYGASRDIKDLIRPGLAASEKKGGRVYRILETAAPPAVPDDLMPLLEVLREQGFIKNADVRQALGVSREHATDLLNAWREEECLHREGERRGTRYLPGPKLKIWGASRPSHKL